MRWYRQFMAKYFNPWIRNLPVEKRQSYVSALRVAYLFSASSAFLIYLEARSKLKEERLSRRAQPFEDISPVHAALRRKGVEKGVIVDYNPEEGFKQAGFNLQEYYDQLEENAMEKARKEEELSPLEDKPIADNTSSLSDSIKVG